MAIELEIKFDGDVPGIAEHRLSVDAFGPALEKLLASFRRIASGVVREAIGPDYGTGGGRYTKEAEHLDIQIQEIGEGSLKLALVLALRLITGQAPLFQDLPERAARAFLDAVEAESQGHLQNAVVRKYLAALPSGVTSQSYRLTNGGTVLRELALGTVSLSNELEDLPALVAVSGFVSGATFAPGKPAVILRSDDGAASRLTASDDQVDRALTLRGRQVEAGAVAGDKSARLLWLRDAAEPVNAPSIDERTAAIFARWDGLLARLAK